MKKKMPSKNDTAYFRFRDFAVVVLCLSGAAFSLNLFRLDLFQTFRSYHTEPAGIVTVRFNTVQRRMADRVVWDRLRKSAYVYSGDLIRVAQLSGAVLEINGSSVELNENSLIKIQSDSSGPPRIELSSGSLCLLASGDDAGKLVLDIMGYRLETYPGTILSADSGQDGMLLKVNEGKILINDKGIDKEAAEGTALYLDTSGGDRKEIMAVVKKPRPYARYVNSGGGALDINFSWSRINMDPGEPLMLEFAQDRNFSRIVRSLGDLRVSATAPLNNGVWYWRLSGRNAILESGQLSVLDGRGPVLYEPAMNAVLPYQAEPAPVLKFRWSEVPGASYCLEVAESLNFNNPRIETQVEGSYYLSSKLGQGTWFWRVRPLFPYGYEGSGNFSTVSSFRIE